tara:strand:- start:369 stop:830 length:462 start_codon:yes stop_codon:yes gene_type:complete
MNIKNKIIAFFIFFSILILSIFNIRNTEKINLYLLTSKIERISLGNLISIAFISGFTISSLLTLISKNKLQESVEDYLINDDEIAESDKDNSSQKMEYDRPPERDIRESQPTISVNYRFVDQDRKSYSSKNTKETENNINNENNDWVNYDNEW